MLAKGVAVRPQLLRSWYVPFMGWTPILGWSPDHAVSSLVIADHVRCSAVGVHVAPAQLVTLALRFSGPRHGMDMAGAMSQEEWAFPRLID